MKHYTNSSTIVSKCNTTVTSGFFIDKKNLPRKLNKVIGKFVSLINHTYITDQTTKQLVELFMEKNPQCVTVLEEYPITFFEIADKKIQKKKLKQV